MSKMLGGLSLVLVALLACPGTANAQCDGSLVDV